jgi:hypothetical protein
MTNPSTTQETRELEPCPLIHPIEKGLNISSSSGMRKWHITCFDCGLYFEGMLDETARSLFTRWNTRALTDEVARLREALEKVADQAQRASLVQDRSVHIIKQACAFIAKGAHAALQPKAEGEQGK